MYDVMIAGAGKIGSLIAHQLAKTGTYEVYVVDKEIVQLNHTAAPHIHYKQLDLADKTAATYFLEANRMQAVISCLPYHCNVGVAELAREYGLHYFDLTEDVHVTAAIRTLAENANTAFTPQCGLAPGIVGIIANDLITRFDSVESVSMRVGALPVHPNNALKYALTWSTDGLINEYANLCDALQDGKKMQVLPLEGLETVQIDGSLYEAFNTSGGLGSLPDIYAGKIKTLNYKTVRYPGHCEQMRFLMNDLQLSEDKPTLKRILEKAIPKTYQDMVLLYISVTGLRQGRLIEENYVRKFYPEVIDNQVWTAIQLTTANGACAVLDTVLSNANEYSGFIQQEALPLETILVNRFGKYFA
jgi:saccharopine dehydrogenase-like NADP-dependent oxidoreductase